MHRLAAQVASRHQGGTLARCALGNMQQEVNGHAVGSMHVEQEAYGPCAERASSGGKLKSISASNRRAIMALVSSVLPSAACAAATKRLATGSTHCFVHSQSCARVGRLVCAEL